MASQVQQLWMGLDRRARAVILITMALGGVALAVLLRFGSAMEMTPLYTGLAPEDAARIADQLKAERVPYRLTEGGGTVLAPRERVYELRISLAKEGLPASGQVGFEVFDRSTLPGTQFNNQVNYQRALQGELSRTIGAMEEVRSARVHIVLPEESLFAEKTKASAAVVVQPEAGHELTADTTAAISQLVASAVKDVPAGEVTVVDTAGRVLHGPEMGGGTGAFAGSHLQIRQQYEEKLAHSLQTMLDAVLGPSKSVVRVRAELDFDTQELRTETLLPGTAGRGLLTSEKTSEEQYQGTREGTGGSAGLDANLGAPGLAIREGRGGTYVQRDETREFQFSRNSTQVVKAPGRVKGLSVAAIIDEDLPGVAEQQVRELLQAASGVDRARGDTIAVQRMKISAAATAQGEQEALAKQERSQRMGALWRTALRSSMSLIAAVILFLTVNTVLKQLRTAPLAPREGGRGGGSGLPQEAVQEPVVESRRGPMSGEMAATPAAMRQALRELTAEDADAVADRLLTMLRENQPVGRG